MKKNDKKNKNTSRFIWKEGDVEIKKKVVNEDKATADKK